MYRVVPLKVGACNCEGPLIYFQDDFGKRGQLYYYMWMVTDNRVNILVDTGFTAEEAHKFMPELCQEPDENPYVHLKKLGVSPEDIGYVIVTHAHFDHLSPLISAYRNARIIMQRKELLYSIIPPHPWFRKFVVEDVVLQLVRDYPNRLLLVDGDVEILPGIQALLTGGHTPGHQSVVVQTKQGRVSIAGDVVFTYRNLEEDIPVGLLTNIEECFMSMERLRNTSHIVLPGHDPLVLDRYGEGI